MTDIQSLLNLPLETIAILGVGYLGYRIAYTGQMSHHRTVDITFISLAFGMLYKLFIDVVKLRFEIQELAIFFAGILTFVLASLWRKWGISAAQRLLRVANISYSDGKSSAWDSMRVSTNDRPTQLIIRVQNGPALMCDYLKDFEAFPHGPCLFGEDGSVSLYVTHIRPAGADEWILATWTKTELGHQITYVPSSNVGFIEVRYLTT